MDKRQLVDYCFEYVGRRIQEIELAIASADQSLKDETKSSAGDKYETSREMIQQDLNRYQQQLAVAQQDKSVLEKLDLAPTQRVSIGSLIKTDSAVYFVAISVGIAKLDGVPAFVISPKSPIGQLLLGKRVGEQFSFQGNTQTIHEIL